MLRRTYRCAREEPAVSSITRRASLRRGPEKRSALSIATCLIVEPQRETGRQSRRSHLRAMMPAMMSLLLSTSESRCAPVNDGRCGK
jgi:hypothetical protein